MTNFYSRVFLLLVTLLPCLTVMGQKNIGVAKIVNISHFDMDAGTQNWQIQQDSAGTMYIANNNGLITFNGKEWKSYPIPNHTILRSLKIIDQKRIYAGGQGMFGYFIPHNSGLQYVDLTKLIPKEHQDFGDTWRIEQFENHIFFQTSRYIFQYDGKKITVLPAARGTEWSFLAKNQGRLYIAEKDKLYEWKQGKLTLIRKDIFAYITGLTDLGKEGILVSLLTEQAFLIKDNGTSPFHLPSEIVNQQVNSISELENEQYAIGTVSNGLYIVDKNWKIIQNINSSDGLRNNTVLSSLVDKNARLWLGLDNGIAIIDANSAIRNIYPLPQVPMASYTSSVYDNKLFIGTTDGVYQTTIDPDARDLSYSSHAFKKMQNSKGQVWNFAITSGEFYMLHHTGTYHYQNNNFVQMNQLGSWLVKETKDKQLLIGTYNGLFSSSNGLKDLMLLGKMDESMRFLQLEKDERYAWTSHPYRGVYRYHLENPQEKAKLYGHEEGLPAQINNYVYKIKDQILVTNPQGIYRFDHHKNRFIRDEYWNALFGNNAIIYLKEDQQNRVWFVSEERLGVLDLSTKKITFFPELEKNMIGGFYHINPVDGKNILVGSYNGLFHINYEVYRSRMEKPVISFNKILVSNQVKDSILMNGYFSSQLSETKKQDQELWMPPAFNSIILDICNHDFQKDAMQYAYRIQGQGDWSNWTSESTRTFGNLKPGKYVFEVKAKNRYDQESETLSYTVNINKPWYQSLWAIIIYCCLGLGLVYLGYTLYLNQLWKQKERFEKKQRDLTYLHELESRDKEHKITELEKEKLQNDLMYKNKELASITMNIFRRSRLMDRMKLEMEEVIANIDNRETKNEVEKIVKKLVDHSKQRDDWEQFSLHFDAIHANFLKKIKNKYPALTATDLKLCAYIKLNMSSKEIAQILHISPKGVEVARYRLRKKLNLDQQANLADFLNDI